MSSYKLTFKLKQITPMIHFQWDEDGACIRGSELKPKFDKFILANENLYKNDSLEINDSCYIDKEKRALNYKVRIVPCAGDKEVSQTIERDIAIANAKSPEEKKRIRKQYEGKGINALYFGNMAKNDDDRRETYKESIMYSEGVEITFICSNNILREIINQAFEAFIAVTNFGTRQNKGFGCFITNDLTKEKQIEILQKMNCAFFYCETKKEEDKLTLVDAIYSCMKGGKNMKVASFVQKYYLTNGKQGDKAFIKWLSRGNNGNPGNFEFVRALLGLADHMRFGTVNIKSVDNSEDKSEDGKIDRYKSPFTVKILDDSIFFIYEDTFEQIKGKKFRFSGKNKRSGVISVPNEFDIDDFIERFVKYCNGENNQEGELQKYSGIHGYEKAAGLKLIANEREKEG